MMILIEDEDEVDAAYITGTFAKAGETIVAKI